MKKVESEKKYLGIELGSTRIKAVIINEFYEVISSGSYQWENKYEKGYWTYSLEDIHKGVQECFAAISQDYYSSYKEKLENVDAMGISAMMHGYFAFDKDDNLLVPFRTWRNTTTKKAAEHLSELFNFNVPQRWSVAHLYQAIIDDEPHINEISKITTLAGYIHYLLTGKHHVGIGEASGMFPVKNFKYDEIMLNKFRSNICGELEWDIEEVLPDIQIAGYKGAYLTEAGAKFLDPTGVLKAGIPVCPPEGDAGTGMMATNSVMPGTGNISAGTSAFSMLVLEKDLENVHPEIDIVATPDGHPVAMVHCNNCCGELDVWINLFEEFCSVINVSVDKSKLYELLYKLSEDGDADCGGVVACNYHSGEQITDISSGTPLVLHNAERKLTMANFVKAQLCSVMATLRLGMNILFEKEEATARIFYAHGGLFKVKGVAQQLLADALNTPVGVFSTAGEGGAWGMALLAAYMIEGEKAALSQWLSESVFMSVKKDIKEPDAAGVRGFDRYMDGYKKVLAAEKTLEEEIQCWKN